MAPSSQKWLSLCCLLNISDLTSSFKTLNFLLSIFHEFSQHLHLHSLCLLYPARLRKWRQLRMKGGSGQRCDHTTVNFCSHEESSAANMRRKLLRSNSRNIMVAVVTWFFTFRFKLNPQPILFKTHLLPFNVMSKQGNTHKYTLSVWRYTVYRKDCLWIFTTSDHWLFNTQSSVGNFYVIWYSLIAKHQILILKRKWETKKRD